MNIDHTDRSLHPLVVRAALACYRVRQARVGRSAACERAALAALDEALAALAAHPEEIPGEGGVARLVRELGL